MLHICLYVASMYTSTSTSVVLLLLLETSVSTSTSIATYMCASTITSTHPSTLLDLRLVAALGLMHGIAEPPVCDWGTACPRMPGNR